MPPIQLPVPPQLRAEAGLPLPHPVLQPVGGDGCVESFEPLGEIEHLLRSTLQAHDRTAQNPLRQGAHPARIFGVLLYQLGRVFPAEDLAPHPGGEDLDLDSVLLPQIKGGVLVVLQKQRTHLARYVVRHAGVAGVRAPASVGLPVCRERYGLLAPSYALLLDKNGDLFALHVEVGVLRPEAEEILPGVRGVGQIDPVVRLLHLRLEAQTPPGHGREGQRVIDIFSTQKTPGYDQRLSLLLDAVYRLVRVNILYLVLDKEVPARLADRLLAPGGRDEALPWDAAPQDAVGIGTVRDAQEVARSVLAPPGFEFDHELANPVRTGIQAPRHSGERTGDLAGFSAEEVRYKDGQDDRQGDADGNLYASPD